MNAGEFGVQFVFAASFDLSAETNLTLNFLSPTGVHLTVQAPAVTIQNSPLVTPFGTLDANTYALYTFQQADITEPGTWFVRLSYDASGPVHLISNTASFLVGP